MYKLIALCVLLTVTGGCTANNSIRADYIVENVQVISMESPDILYDRAVIIHDNKIKKIIKQSKAANVDAVQRIDGKGQYLMPGLADMHVHVRWNPEQMFQLFLANGVTTAANMLLKDGDFDHIALRDKLNSGELIGPRY